MIPEPVLDHINKNVERSFGDLFEFLGIPDISPLESHAGDVRHAAEWLLGRVSRLGFEARLYETPGHPIVYGEMCHDKNVPTLMFYAHYDVTPPGRLEEWKTPPFIPAMRDDAVYARGAVDDKGQLCTILTALKSIIAVEGKLPLNVKLLFEGEEEMGSPDLKAFICGHKELLRSDAIVIIDIVKYRDNLPAIYYSAKGLIYVTVEVSGPAIAAHSGIYGGEIANPAQALAWMIGSLKDRDGKILIPGFYEHVRDLTPEERSEIASLPFDESQIKALLGISALSPERGYSPLECAMARPTLDVNGIWGGALPGAPEMIIPSSAGALISIRLVPDQRPEDIYRLFKTHIRSITPPGTNVQFHRGACSSPFITLRNSDAVRAASMAIEYAFGTRPVLIRSGGTSAVVPLLEQFLGARDIIITGWGDPGAGEHSPDEHFSFSNFRKGVIATAAMMYALAGIKTGRASASSLPAPMAGPS